MKKLNNSGFGILEGLLILVILGVIGGVGFYVYSANKETNESLDNTGNSETTKLSRTPTDSEQPEIPAGYKEYKNKQYGFSFAYPEEWTEVDISNKSAWDSATIVGLVSPKQLKAIEDFKARNIITAGPVSTDIVVSRWSGAYEGRPTEKLGDKVVAGQKMDEVIIGGYSSSYGLMFEKSGIYYQVEFPAKESKDQATDETNTIIQSLKFN